MPVFSLGYVLKASKCTKKTAQCCEINQSVCWKFLKRFSPNLLDQSGLAECETWFSAKIKATQATIKNTGAGLRMRRGTVEAVRTSLQSSLNANADLSNHYTCGLKGQELCLKVHKNGLHLCIKCVPCTYTILWDTLFLLIFKGSLDTV